MTSNTKKKTARRYCDYCHGRLSPFMRGDVRFCSGRCRVAMFRKKQRVLPADHGSQPVDLDSPIGGSGSVARKQAVADGDRITHREVIEVRGQECWLCSKPIDLTLPHGHPEALTADHLIPVSKGGVHSMSNLAPAHRVCNASKNDRLISFECWQPTGPAVRLDD